MFLDTRHTLYPFNTGSGGHYKWKTLLLFAINVSFYVTTISQLDM